MTKYTDKEIYTAIVEGTFEDLDVDTIVAWAQKKIASITNKAAKAKERATAKKAEGDELNDAVAEAIGAEPVTAQEIADALADEFPEVTKAKVTYRAGQLVKDGVIFKVQVKTEDNRKVVAYTTEEPDAEQ